MNRNSKIPFQQLKTSLQFEILIKETNTSKVKMLHQAWGCTAIGPLPMDGSGLLRPWQGKASFALQEAAIVIPSDAD